MNIRKLAPILVISGLALGSCGKQSSGPGKKEFVVGFANSSMSHPWRVAIHNAVGAEAAKHPDIRLITTQADEIAEKQLGNVETMLAQGIDMLVICTVSGEGSKPIADACARANVPIVTVDRNIAGGGYTAFVGQSNVQFGRDMADFIATELTKKNGRPEGAVVELRGRPADLPSMDRGKGFAERIAEKYPDIRIVASQSTDYTRTNSRGVMENIVQSNPRIDAVYTHEDEIALGAITSLKEANRLAGTIVTGCGGSGAALLSVKAGEMTACGTYSPIDAGTIGMRAAVKLLRGEQVPKEVPLYGAIVTKENVDSFWREGLKEADYVHTVDLAGQDLPTGR